MPEFEKRTPPGVGARRSAPQRKVERDRLSWLQFSAEPDRYDRMPYRRCGGSGLKLPAISLGAWETFGGYRGPETSRECIFRAFNLGITHFDLANNYGRPPGRAETVVGRILCEMPRAEMIISTKAGFEMWPGPYGQGCSRKSLLASVGPEITSVLIGASDIAQVEENVRALENLKFSEEEFLQIDSALRD